MSSGNAENAGQEKAGLENDGQNVWLKMQDRKITDNNIE